VYGFSWQRQDAPQRARLKKPGDIGLLIYTQSWGFSQPYSFSGAAPGMWKTTEFSP
jgi:hypothetical protein